MLAKNIGFDFAIRKQYFEICIDFYTLTDTTKKDDYQTSLGMYCIKLNCIHTRQLSNKI